MAPTPGGRLIVGADEAGTCAVERVDANAFDHRCAEAGASPRAVCARPTRQPRARRRGARRRGTIAAAAFRFDKAADPPYGGPLSRPDEAQNRGKTGTRR